MSEPSPTHQRVRTATAALEAVAVICLYQPDLQLELRQAAKRLGTALEALASQEGVHPRSALSRYLPAPYKPGKSHGQGRLETVGSKALLFAILHRAAADWVLYRTSRRLLFRQLAEESFVWIFREDHGDLHGKERHRSRKQLTSFLAICEALDFDPESVRDRIRKLTPQKIIAMGRPAEFRRRRSAASLEESARR